MRLARIGISIFTIIYDMWTYYVSGRDDLNGIIYGGRIVGLILFFNLTFGLKEAYEIYFKSLLEAHKAK